ncbi:procollagen-lysine,2-oxoglutarate 5-dioxygenase 2-like [Ctenocephalides felis]|uniref:procollagen-lysine,2-oxoglutarate 5-dioxygenase 2-like n=1 Tax=Ctenocephalides felis TaxID=7515 RepID=UPI000E6E2D8C|nr:procollagen-lysine,2-oxoglutarate 5-dioxygenase 2-like [Ctenocephalides felis]
MLNFKLYFSLCVFYITASQIRCDDQNDGEVPLVFTVASERTDGFLRYERSTREYGIQPKVLGFDQPWRGGSMELPGGGYKVNLLIEALEPFKDDDNKIAIFTDSYDVMFLAPTQHIVDKFLSTGARILFSAEPFCWPDVTLADKYPEPENGGKKFLNSGMFIGYVSDLYKLLSYAPIQDTDDDQLFYTKAYLNEEIRANLKIKLDHKSEIFQNMNGAAEELKLDFESSETGISMLNTEQRTRPSVVHGNGPSKILLNNFGNYLANAWKATECPLCHSDTIQLKEGQFPTVGLSIFIEKPTPFLEEFFDNVLTLNYPKENIHVFIHNTVPEHADIVNKFYEVYGPEYKSRKSIIHSDNTIELEARELAL